MVVEWGEKARDYLPEQYYLITFTVISENERRIEIAYTET